MDHEYILEEEHAWEEPYELTSDEVYFVEDLQTASIPFDGGCSALLVFPVIALFLLVTGLLLGLGSTALPSLELEADDSVTLLADKKPAVVEAAQNSEENKNGGEIATFFTPEVQYWEANILDWAEAWELDANMVATVIQIESCGDPLALSHAGARGLFQVMPYHFKGGENAYTPDTNAKRGLAYLRQSLEASKGNTRLAFAGYNGGINGVKRAEALWPAETIRYSYWGENIYQDALKGKADSAYLDEWLGSGGASLCNQANQRLGLAP